MKFKESEIVVYAPTQICELHHSGDLIEGNSYIIAYVINDKYISVWLGDTGLSMASLVENFLRFNEYRNNIIDNILV